MGQCMEIACSNLTWKQHSGIMLTATSHDAYCLPMVSKWVAVCFEASKTTVTHCDKLLLPGLIAVCPGWHSWSFLLIPFVSDLGHTFSSLPTSLAVSSLFLSSIFPATSLALILVLFSSLLPCQPSSLCFWKLPICSWFLTLYLQFLSSPEGKDGEWKVGYFHSLAGWGEV